MRKGALYMVATPIGHLDDLSFRALETLKKVDLIAAEDTRHSKRLLAHYGVQTRLISLHQHNEKFRAEQLLGRIVAGESVALVSDAGTPAINDPGSLLVKQALEQEIQVIPIPGACSLIAALSASGLPASPFYYGGFLPSKRKERQDVLDSVIDQRATLVFFETPHRLLASIGQMRDVLGAERQAVLAKELTKMHELLLPLPLAEMADWVESHPERVRGEFVLVVEGAPEDRKTKDFSHLAPEMAHLLGLMPLKQVVEITHKMTGHPKNALYEMALVLKG